MSFTEQFGFFLLFFFSVVFRELVRGYTATLFGDTLPYQSDRLTINPIKHIDLFGTIILPIVFVLFGVPAIGWAKPMPIQLSIYRKTWIKLLVISSGMLANAFLIAVSLVIIFIVSNFSSALAFTLPAFGLLAYINIILVIFHIIPVPPLDGFLLLSEIPAHAVKKCTTWIQNLHPLILFIVILGIWNILYPVVQFLYAHLVS